MFYYFDGLFNGVNFVEEFFCYYCFDNYFIVVVMVFGWRKVMFFFEINLEYFYKFQRGINQDGIFNCIGFKVYVFEINYYMEGSQVNGFCFFVDYFVISVVWVGLFDVMLLGIVDICLGLFFYVYYIVVQFIEVVLDVVFQ